MKRIITSAFVVLLAMFVLQVSAQEGSEIVTGNEIGNDIGDFEAKGPDGEFLKLSDLRGKVVMVVLWNSLCNHCVSEIKNYQAAWEGYHDKEFVNGSGFDIYQIALDKEEATWHEALEKMNLPYKNHVYVLDSWKDPDIRFFGVKNLPGTFLIDQNGIILDKMFDGKDIPSILDKYIKK